MTISLNTATGGMDAFQQMLDVIGNNIANENTTGFKSSSAQFSDVLNQTITQGAASGAPTGNIGGTNPKQVGLGVQVAQIYRDFSQGSSETTSNPNDLMISGSGFFILSSSPTGSITGNNIEFSRAGHFSVDSNGYLVAPNGMYLMGVSGNNTAYGGAFQVGGGFSATGGSYTGSLVAINVNVSGTSASTTGTATSYSVGPDGQITLNGVSGTSYELLLANFENPDGLIDQGNNNYTWSASAGTGTAGLAVDNPAFQSTSLSQGMLEASNVDLTKEMSNMIVAQTGYDANSKVINTVNGMLQFMIQQV